MFGLFKKKIAQPVKEAKTDFDRLMQEQLKIIEESPLDPILSNGESDIYCQMIVLNGYRSLSLVITGCININTIEGCKLVLISDNGNYECNSDGDIVKGDYSERLQIGVTNFDIDLDDELVDFVANQNITSAQIQTRNGQLRKSVIEITYPTVNQEIFNKILNAVEEED
ncbi:MAG: hypothetical protein P8I55_15815 [Crocinitomix sp.]|nr:hypothetical protein [Crocinitomix sp.]